MSSCVSKCILRYLRPKRSIVIPWQELLNGAELACENARRLAEDASFLGDNGHRQSAYTLSVVGMEEINKAGLLLKNHLEKRDLSKTGYENIFRDHKWKLRSLNKYWTVLYPGATSRSFTQQEIKALNLVHEEKLRVGLYVDFDPNADAWSSPKDLDNWLDKIDPKWRDGLADVTSPWKVYSTSVMTLSEEIAKRVHHERSET